MAIQSDERKRMRIRTKRQLFVTTVLMVALCVAFSATAFAKVDKRKKVHSIYWKARLKTDVSSRRMIAALQCCQPPQYRYAVPVRSGWDKVSDCI